MIGAQCRFGYGMWRRSRALKDLPGPKYNSVVGVMHLLSVRDMHRVCTEYAEKYGPIFKMRLLTFHVSSLHIMIDTAIHPPHRNLWKLVHWALSKQERLA